MNNLTLLSLASKQIWPQVLTVSNAKPKRLVLLHTSQESESKRPAERLKELFVTQGLLGSDAVELALIPHDHFGAITDAIGGVAERLELDDSNCRLNLTGGNKIMAMAAAEWCRLAGVPFFYLERDYRVFPFVTKGNDVLPQPEYQLNQHLADFIDATALLRCQLDGAEIVSQGQKLLLNEKGSKLPEHEIGPLLKKNEDFHKFLHCDVPEHEKNAGTNLEYATALALLKLGVPSVQRSVRLKPRVLRGVGMQESELDLVFNWAGKLWVVDCKDRISAQQRITNLRTELLKQYTLTPDLGDELEKIESDLKARQLVPLKEDLLAVSEVGGLLGRAICVRRSPLEPQAAEYAKSRGLDVVLKDRLVSALRPLLHPNQPASLEQLKTLARARTGAAA